MSRPVSCEVCTYKKDKSVYRRHNLEFVHQKKTSSNDKVFCFLSNIVRIWCFVMAPKKARKNPRKCFQLPTSREGREREES